MFIARSNHSWKSIVKMPAKPASVNIIVYGMVIMTILA